MHTVDFFGNKLGRLIVGGNPFNGYSYIPNIKCDEMLDYYTTERIIRDLKYAETLGYTAFISTTEEHTRRWYRQYKNEGGTLAWIGQTYPPMDMQVSVNNAVECGAIAIFHQGTHFDGLMENGEYDTVKRNLEVMRGAGIPVGIATHVPAHVDIAEKEFGVDFYMACLHNLRRKKSRAPSSVSGKKDEEHEFFREDRAAMLEKIRSLSKPCIAYKFLGGGNYAFDYDGLKQCFVETYSGIKACDVATVGIFQRDRDQLKENVEVLEEVLGES
ncbi:MAG: hypothetical protein FWD16_03750 [Clostridia bacterium]|nr:hypothetical protein [Clostridia bacterium]